ncbi:MAG: hypothetical protein JWR69_1537 [Pedosphaera sp.]|nr:hypothetical protein [Pedosphaera sp.]
MTQKLRPVPEMPQSIAHLDRPQLRIPHFPGGRAPAPWINLDLPRFLHWPCASTLDSSTHPGPPATHHHYCSSRGDETLTPCPPPTPTPRGPATPPLPQFDNLPSENLKIPSRLTWINLDLPGFPKLAVRKHLGFAWKRVATPAPPPLSPPNLIIFKSENLIIILGLTWISLDLPGFPHWPCANTRAQAPWIQDRSARPRSGSAIQTSSLEI